MRRESAEMGDNFESEHTHSTPTARQTVSPGKHEPDRPHYVKLSELEAVSTGLGT